MRLVIASLLVALVAAAPASASAAPRKPKPNCSMKGSKTVLRAPGVRVFTGRPDEDEEAVEEGAVLLYACLTSNGRKRELSESFESSYDGSGSDFSDVRLAGRYVAWHFSTFDGSCKADCPDNYDQSDESVIVYDLQRGRVAQRSMLPDFTDLTSGSLALTQHGGVAWLSPDPAGTPQLFVLDRDGRRVLDTGNIAADSVRAEISIVSWVRDGVEQFARLH